MATYYISPTGNDTTGDGSIGTPWATLAKAITASANDDTIYCRAGTYAFANQTISRRYIRGYPGEVATFAISTGSDVTWTLNRSLLGAIEFSDLTFTSVLGTLRFFVREFQPSPVRFVRCQFINVQQPGGYALFQTFNETANYYELTLTACLFAGIKSTLSFVNPEGYITLNVINCTIYDNSTSGGVPVFIRAFAPMLATIKNTIIVAGPSRGTINYTQSYAAGQTYTHNNNCTVNVINLPAGGTGNITSDPLFVDAAGGNFALRPGSPCLDTGTLS